jgi:hypothetical protein
MSVMNGSGAVLGSSLSVLANFAWRNAFQW